MTGHDDLTPAIAARERARSRVRAITVTAGVAALATSGFIAFNLPAPAHQQATTGTAGTAGTSPGGDSPATSAPAGGDGGSERSGDDEGGAQVPAPTSPAAAGSSHATSGGS